MDLYTLYQLSKVDGFISEVDSIIQSHVLTAGRLDLQLNVDLEPQWKHYVVCIPGI
jgi:hypothetical protein